MKRLSLIVLLALLASCAEPPLPALVSSPDPTDAAGPSADIPYRPVLAGTMSHGVGDRP